MSMDDFHSKAPQTFLGIECAGGMPLPYPAPEWTGGNAA